MLTPDLLSFSWLEGDRTFSIVFGTITSAACFAVAVPTLWWYLPKHRRRLFPTNVDPRQKLQFWFGMFAMAMAFTNALCRYIPHGRLGYTHPVFFFTTIVLVVFLGSRVIAAARHRILRVQLPSSALAFALAVLFVVPLTATVVAFLP